MLSDTNQIHIGPEVGHTAREICRGLDCAISSVAGDECTGLRGRVLGFLRDAQREGRPVYQRDVEAKFHIGRSSVTTLLQGMEAAGLIERQAVKGDARLKQLVLTPRGEECHKKIAAALECFEQQLVRGLTEEELRALSDALRRLRENLAGMQSGRP